MLPDIRRIIAVEAHRRRSGEYPRRIYSLGTGETFDIAPQDDGFIDLVSGLRATVDGGTIRLPNGHGPIDLNLIGDVSFDGYDHASQERFSGRAGGGASVTVYERGQNDYFQYAIAADRER